MTENYQNYYFLDSIIKGGWVMLPLMACSLLSLTIIIQRLIWGPTKERVIPTNLLNEAIRLINNKKIEELVSLCRMSNSAFAKILEAALLNLNKPHSEITEAVETIGKKEAMSLEQNLSTLNTIAGISPLLGLLGTVFGMITTFNVIKTHGTGDPGLMAGGIAEALITTATGLTIAIPSLFFYRYFNNKIKKLIVDLETTILSLIRLAK